MEENKYPHIERPWEKFYPVNMQSFPENTLTEYMKSFNKKYEEMAAMDYFGRKISYGELFEHIDTSSRVLSAIGVKSNDRIMYMLPNIPETAYLMYGGSQIGAVSDFVDPRPDSIDLKTSANKIFELIKSEKIKYIVALDLCYLGMLKPIENELKDYGIDKIIIVSPSDSMNLKSTGEFVVNSLYSEGFSGFKNRLKRMREQAELLKKAESSSPIEMIKYCNLVEECRYGSFDKVDYDPNRLEVIVHTSGTTSNMPKPIPLSTTNLNTYVQSTFNANMPMNVGDRVLHVLPYFAAFGLVDVVHAGFCHTNNLIQIPEFNPAKLGELIVTKKAQTVIGTPSWFSYLTSDPKLKKADLSFVSMMTYGGDSMTASDEVRVNNFLKEHNCGCILTKGHGMSEICGCGSYAIGEYNLLSSMGIPMPGVVYTIVDPETKQPVPFDEAKGYAEGELAIKSSTTTSGILDGKIITPRIMIENEEYILTNDIAQMSKEGIMTFLSRSNRGFTRFDGYKIKPYEIEKEILRTNPDISSCVISGYYDKEKCGNMPVLTVVLDNSEMSIDDEIEFVRNLIENAFINNSCCTSRQIPSRVRFVKELPLSSNSKILYRELDNMEMTGDEIIVELEETNISVDNVNITHQKSGKKKTLLKK